MSGLAVERTSGAAPSATAAGLGDEQQGVVGTFTYSAPEQTGMLNREVDGSSDLYSVGVIQLVNAIALREPWVAVLGLGAYSLLGFGFFVALLSELIRPDDA